MDRQERVKHIEDILYAALDRITREYCATVAETIGVLEIAKLNIYREQQELQEGEDDEDNRISYKS